ncbi:MAG TPA: hypothetical protein DCS15_02335 [Flavobacteriales bacterium]|jgi:membrane protease YdiL (CAAX protease family)|nr:hypothetical protein [Flavobacteriales bacterium]
MSLNGRLKDEPAGAKLFWLLFISLGFFFVSGLLALLLSEPLFGIDMIGNPSLARDFGDPQVIRAMKFSQTVNAIGFFIIPPILFAWLCGTDLRSFFGLGRPLKLFPIAAAVLLVIAALPLENFVATLSDAIHFPDIIAGWETNLRNMQEETERTVVAFLKMEDLGDLGINLMMVALLPAVGEEMLFRGWFQPLLIQRFRSVHMGIWITAALFSLIHMQFFAFFPRLIMGAALGYLFYWSRSIYLPMLAHFLNNALAILALYFIHQGSLPEGVEDTGSDNIMLFSLSAAAVAVILFGLRRFYNEEGH